jgi:4-amino-4-deoxy-L-arabinose transferase-like glycosyltransferase
MDPLPTEPELPEETPSAPNRTPPANLLEILRRYRLVITLLGIIFLYAFYVNGVSTNPPGFYIDECAIAYNAYCIAHTGAGEFGNRWPLFFPVYTSGWIQYANPTQIYLLAIPFTIFRPSILLARIFSATWVFAACVLLGLLAKRISGQRRIGIIVAITAILTPWLFEVSRLVMETYFYPMALVLFLLALFHAQRKESWSWLTVGMLAVTLMLLTYTYTIGRLLGPLMGLGLVFFITSQDRLLGVIKTWVVFALTLIPLLIFRSKHPEALTQRFYLISYIKPDSTWKQIAPTFIRRYLSDFSVVNLLIDGDGNPRHHVQGSLGSFLVAAFILVLIGLVVVIVRHWREPWWRFVIFGAAASIVPGALTPDQFHSLRLVAYPVFLLVLMVPGLAFLLERPPPVKDDLPPNVEIQTVHSTRSPILSSAARQTILAVLLAVIGLQAIYFQSVYRREGRERGWVFDSAYKDLYDAAVALPARPIYLSDGTEPAYEHAYWYAAVEGRKVSEFVHLDEGTRAPVGSLVIGSEPTCVNCQVIKKSGDYLLYWSF